MKTECLEAVGKEKGCSMPRQRQRKQKVILKVHLCRHCFANKGPSSQSYDFSSSHIWM